MQKNVEWMQHEWPAAGGAVSDFLYPGAALDPDYAVNGIVWLASGIITTIHFRSAADTAGVRIRIYDAMDANGRPVQLAVAPFYRHAIIDTGATAKRAGIGTNSTTPAIPAGTPIVDVFGLAEPTAITTNGLRWDQTARHEPPSGTTQIDRNIEHILNMRCSFGMAVRVTAAAPAAARPLRVTVGYIPEVTGMQRYARAQRGTVSGYIPA